MTAILAEQQLGLLGVRVPGNASPVRCAAAAASMLLRFRLQYVLSILVLAAFCGAMVIEIVALYKPRLLQQKLLRYTFPARNWSTSLPRATSSM